MTLQELKTKIKNKEIDNSLIVFKYEENGKFVCEEYIKEISKILNKERVRINSFSEIDRNTLVDGPLYILDLDTLKENPENINNTIIMCKKIDKDLKVNFIEVPKLTDWQIQDYLAARLPGLSDLNRGWLFVNTKKDIYRIAAECDKLSCFSKANQDLIFSDLRKENCYIDLTSKTIFDFCNAWVKKDVKLMEECLAQRFEVDIEASAVPTILIRQLKQIINVKFAKAYSPDLGVTTKQYYFFKNNLCKNFTDMQLVNLFEIINDLDYKLKSGIINYLDMVDYLIIKRVEL